MKTNRNKAIVVLGFHRGGTSALAGALAISGVKTPKTLIAPVDSENEKGFWESVFLSRLNDDLLKGGGQSWDNLTLDGFSFDRNIQATDDQIQALKESLIEEFPNSEDTILIKDPRICRLIPIWQRVLDELGYDPVFVLITRSPFESARSLQERNSIPEVVGLLLWMQYMASAERDTRSSPRVVIRYSDLLSNPEACMRTVGQTLNVSLHDSAAHLHEMREFLDTSLRHHIDEGVNKENVFRGLPFKIYELLSNSHNASVQRELESMWETADGVLRLLAPIISDRDSEIADLSAHLETANSHSKFLEVEIPKLKVSLNTAISDFSILEAVLNEEREYRESLSRSALGSFLRTLQKCIHCVQKNRVVAFLVFLLRDPSRARFQLSEFLLIRRSGMFDVEYYLDKHLNLSWMITHPLIHYVSVGCRLGYNPNSGFNEIEYRYSSPETISGTSLAHWIEHRNQ